MATTGGDKGAGVAEKLFREGHRYSFFQVVRLLEMLRKDRHPVAEDLDPSQEAVRFRSHVGFDFPPTEIREVEDRGKDLPPEVTVNFIGLAGANGPLPRAFTELVLDRVSHRDTALRDFLDLFNHRLVSLFYGARRKYRPVLEGRPPNETRLAQCGFALMGLGTPRVRDRMKAPDRALLAYAGLLTGPPRSMIGLQQLLSDYFGLPFEIRPFQGRWLEIAEDDCTLLGRRGRNNKLGVDTVLGGRVWDQQAATEVRVGPIDLQQLLRLLPNSPEYETLCGIVRFYIGDHIAFHVKPVVEAAEVPPLRLGAAAEAQLGWTSRLESSPDGGSLRLGASGGARLGWTSWLTTRKLEADDSQICLQGSA